MSRRRHYAVTLLSAHYAAGERYAIIIGDGADAVR